MSLLSTAEEPCEHSNSFWLRRKMLFRLWEQLYEYLKARRLHNSTRSDSSTALTLLFGETHHILHPGAFSLLVETRKVRSSPLGEAKSRGLEVPAVGKSLRLPLKGYYFSSPNDLHICFLVSTGGSWHASQNILEEVVGTTGEEMKIFACCETRTTYVGNTISTSTYTFDKLCTFADDDLRGSRRHHPARLTHSAVSFS